MLTKLLNLYSRNKPDTTFHYNKKLDDFQRGLWRTVRWNWFRESFPQRLWELLHAKLSYKYRISNELGIYNEPSNKYLTKISTKG